MRTSIGMYRFTLNHIFVKANRVDALDSGGELSVGGESRKER